MRILLMGVAQRRALDMGVGRQVRHRRGPVGSASCWPGGRQHYLPPATWAGSVEAMEGLGGVAASLHLFPLSSCRNCVNCSNKIDGGCLTVVFGRKLLHCGGALDPEELEYPHTREHGEYKNYRLKLSRPGSDNRRSGAKPRQSPAGAK